LPCGEQKRQNLPYMKTNSLSFVLFALLIYFAPTLGVKAVSPAPDGCYPNFTTAEGCNALQSLTPGLANTGIGWYSLSANSPGDYNTAVGAGTLLSNTGSLNTAVGTAALLLNTSGYQNTATGTDALGDNTTGDDNTANGVEALARNATGGLNTAVGFFALSLNNGNGNTAVGYDALEVNAGASENTAGGDSALGLVNGNSNTALGGFAGVGISNGDYNTALGFEAGVAAAIGSNNIYIGDAGSTGDNNVISIGAIAASGTPYENTYIGGISGVPIPTGVAVVVDGNGHLGTTTSSARFKDEVKPMDKASEAILALKPVTFHYKKELDPEGIPQFGLVAEQVEKVNPDLVARDAQGKPYTVRYDAVNAMLLNEFLKEHKKVEALEGTITALAATVKAQAAQIQKVSAQLELSKPGRQTVLNNQ
jgi:Chaperone of endosialidase